YNSGFCGGDMTQRIQVGIVGYGNLGRGAEEAVSLCDDLQLAGIFTRRNPADVQPVGSNVPVYPLADIADFKDTIDVLILCGGSKDDLPEQGPELAALFHTVDSF